MNENEFEIIPTASSERFHSIGAGVLYHIPLENNHNLLLKGFYDYVFLGATPSNSTDYAVVPSQIGLGLIYQIPNVFQKQIKK